MIKKIKNILCSIGWHIPKKDYFAFVDIVDGREVWYGSCECGRSWLFNETMKMPKIN